MEDSILTTIKKLLNISEADTSFDMDLLVHINSVLAILGQLGVGPDGGTSISSESDVWASIMDSDKFLSLTKSYIHLKVKLLFDPPLSSAAIESINKMIAEFEWRLCAMAESDS